MIHFGLTSEDINNLSHTLLMKKYCIEVQLPQIRDMLTLLCKHIAGWKSAAFPARTHGQMASPTTAGKEMAVFASRLLRQAESLETFRFRAKLNGATGNYSAFDAASSEINWQEFSRQFIESLDLEFNPVTTQIEDHDNWGEFFTIVRRFNSIIMDMNQDIWVYLMLGYLKQATIKDEVGSSTMPHKVNPINFENSEGNLGISNALLDHFANKLSRSRLQRDLSDSTVERNFGVAMGHAYLGLSETMRGLKKLEVNEEFCKKELDKYPELLAEPIQTILRRENFQDPYMLMKNLTRGRELKIADLNRFIDTLKIKPNVRRELAELRTVTYFGKAEQICDDFLARSAVFLKSKNGDTE